MDLVADIPSKDLYIYCLEGRINPSHGILGTEFTGNREEDNFLFLFFKTPSRKKK